MLPGWERERVLYEWNETEGEYPREKCVHELLEEQAGKTPEAVAVVCGEEELSYGELNRRANQLAHYLRELGVKPEERVGICVERSVEMVVGVVGVLKAGGAYVPLDPGYPAERLRYMIEDSAPVVLLTQGHLEKWWAGMGDSVRVLDLGSASPPWREHAESSPARDGIGADPQHLAYVIYTSGSTGTPKGVMVTHRNLSNLMYWHCHAFGLDIGQRSSSVAGLGFDAAAWEIWPALCAGAILLLLPPTVGDGNDVEHLLSWWKSQYLDVSFLPTPIAEIAFHFGITNPTLRVLLVGGDCLYGVPKIPLSFCLINNYGPTEATVVAASGAIETSAASISIGRPIANTRIYILDGQGEPVAVGVVGEIYIGGSGVARGYWKRPELTAEKFLEDPFREDGKGRMYRTGDLGRWLGDGDIEFVGRNDFQVKVRGYRIELGEIEARLREREGVGEAVVVAREDRVGEKRLVAYYTRAAAGDREQEQEVVGAEQLRLYLSSSLPEYMVPAAYVGMERMPLTANGKLDRKALPAPEGDAYVVREYEEPEGEMEESLAGIWAEVLHVERVGRQDNFFELGGHSLLAVRVIARVREALKVEVGIRDLFARPVLSDFVRGVERARPNTLPAITLAERGGRIPLSHAQQRLWFINRLEGTSVEYNMPFALRLKGELDAAALERALDTIVERHESLRTRFVEVEGEPFQVIEPECRIELGLEDLSGGEESGQQERVQEALRGEARMPFDLMRGPVLRVKLLRLGAQDHVLVRTMHHIVSDGWSEGVFTHELMVLYEAFGEGRENPLRPLGVQYADFALWQRRWLEAGALDRGLCYWKEQLAGIPERLELPTDRPRPRDADIWWGSLQHDTLRRAGGGVEAV